MYKEENKYERYHGHPVQQTLRRAEPVHPRGGAPRPQRVRVPARRLCRGTAGPRQRGRPAADRRRAVGEAAAGSEERPPAHLPRPSGWRNHRRGPATAAERGRHQGLPHPPLQGREGTAAGEPLGARAAHPLSRQHPHQLGPPHPHRRQKPPGPAHDRRSRLPHPTTHPRPDWRPKLGYAPTWRVAGCQVRLCP